MRIPVYSYFLAASFFVGCSPGLMVYNSTNTPNFTKKAETKIALFSNLTHGELQVAYSPANKLGVWANTYYEFANVGSNGTYITEAACGYFSNLKKENWYFDVYGGLGLGSRKYKGGWNNFFLYNHDDNGISSEYSSYYSKFFGQSSIYHISGRNEVAFTLQSAVFSFSSYSMRVDTFVYGGPHVSSTYNMTEKIVLNINPCITYKYVWNHFGFVLQIASNLAIRNPEFSETNGTLKVYNYSGAKNLNFNSRPLALNIGLQFHFGKQGNQ